MVKVLKINIQRYKIMKKFTCNKSRIFLKNEKVVYHIMKVIYHNKILENRNKSLANTYNFE